MEGRKNLTRRRLCRNHITMECHLQCASNGLCNVPYKKWTATCAASTLISLTMVRGANVNVVRLQLLTLFHSERIHPDTHGPKRVKKEVACSADANGMGRAFASASHENRMGMASAGPFRRRLVFFRFQLDRMNMSRS